MQELELLSSVDSSYEAVRRNFPLSPNAFVAAADRGDLRVAVRTPSGRRLFARADVLAFIEARREARRTAHTRSPLAPEAA